jgi:hypothetical protein
MESDYFSMVLDGKHPLISRILSTYQLLITTTIINYNGYKFAVKYVGPWRLFRKEHSWMSQTI